MAENSGSILTYKAISACLTKSPESIEFSHLVNTLSVEPEIRDDLDLVSSYCFPTFGISLAYCKIRKIFWGIRLTRGEGGFPNRSADFRRYEGTLPNGITFDDSSFSVESKFGSPPDELSREPEPGTDEPLTIKLITYSCNAYEFIFYFNEAAEGHPLVKVGVFVRSDNG